MISHNILAQYWEVRTNMWAGDEAYTDAVSTGRRAYFILL